MVTLDDILAARARIGQLVGLTPCAESQALSRMVGCRLFLKLENLQMTGSFKDRGALSRILRLSDRERAAGVVTASAGNHAQGVAYAARLAGIKATIVMPETTPLAKIRGTQELGAAIVLHGANYDGAYAKARELQTLRGATFIHAFDDADVIAGQGTIGLELLDQVPNLDVVVVPVGGGGLIAGIATAIKALRPQVRIVGVEAERLPAMRASVAAREVCPLAPTNTLADGIAVAVVGRLTLGVVARHVAQLVTVSEEQIAAAIMTLLEREKTLAEGAGATGFAALHAGRVPGIRGKRVAVVISGGNIDMTMLARILERGLESDGRVANLQVVVPDKPGSIAEVARLIATERANILHISQNRHATEVALGEAEVELTLETRGRDHVADIVRCIQGGGFPVKGWAPPEPGSGHNAG